MLNRIGLSDIDYLSRTAHLSWALSCRRPAQNVYFLRHNCITRSRRLRVYINSTATSGNLISHLSQMSAAQLADTVQPVHDIMARRTHCKWIPLSLTAPPAWTSIFIPQFNSPCLVFTHQNITRESIVCASLPLLTALPSLTFEHYFELLRLIGFILLKIFFVNFRFWLCADDAYSEPPVYIILTLGESTIGHWSECPVRNLGRFFRCVLIFTILLVPSSEVRICHYVFMDGRREKHSYFQLIPGHSLYT